MLYFFVGTIANIYLAKKKKNWALLTDLLKVKNNMFLPDNCHTQKRTYSLNTHPQTFFEYILFKKDTKIKTD